MLESTATAAAAAAPPASDEVHANTNASTRAILARPMAGQASASTPAARATDSLPSQQSSLTAGPEFDDFGLPIRPRIRRQATASSDEFQSADDGEEQDDGIRTTVVGSDVKHQDADHSANGKDVTIPKGAESDTMVVPAKNARDVGPEGEGESGDLVGKPSNDPGQAAVPTSDENHRNTADRNESSASTVMPATTDSSRNPADEMPATENVQQPSSPTGTRPQRSTSFGSASSPTRTRKSRASSSADQKTEIGGVSEWSHQALAPPKEEKEVEEESAWQEMPTDSKMDWYDDYGHMVAKGDRDWGEDDYDPAKGGAGRGYTRVQLDDDARSATSMDEHTAYLFKNKGGGTNVIEEEEEDARDPLSQLQATKDLLTEGQRIAYVGVTRLSMEEMKKEMRRIEVTKKFKKEFTNATENLQMWSQKMMVRLYAHMDISSSEQIMIEQLAEHGIKPSDMTQALMQNARIKNPLVEVTHSKTDPKTKPTRSSKDINRGDEDGSDDGDHEKAATPPPPYTEEEKNHVPEAVDPSTLEKKESLDIDLRWTVLCDLFLVLIGDSVYDARSRVLLETVGDALGISWLDICRFEKRITDALEMQEEAAREDWDEADAIENRRKMALKKRYLMMGLATAGGGLLIGLSAGVLAPVIGAGLAAGFSALGVAGTGSFLAGAGGAAIITGSSAIAGGTIAIRASSNRMGAVKTFEYRPLHNNKRVNLIVTIAGWMNGKVDDVRLPFSTVDPIMGDIYSLHWEPDMLQGIGGTIRIIANEALTQGLQQVLAATFLSAILAGLTAPILLSKLSYLIDNPWSSSLDRAERAGLILADSILDRHLGVRPITLVGFSLGSRVIFSCLKELSSRAGYGLVQNVYIFGSPVVANKEEWLRARTVVSGRFVSGYASNDWILGYLFRSLASGLSRVAGLAPVEQVPGVENMDCTPFVNGHMAYRAAMPRLLRELGWDVESDEFTEIEDPDPENHEARQRELIQEIEEARQAAAEGQTKKQSWWSSKRKTQKKSWEMYDKNSAEAGMAAGRTSGDDKDKRNSVLFDIDAIRRELESEHMEVKQLESTLPPMQLSLDKPTERAPEEKSPVTGKPSSLNPFSALRSTKSYNSAADKSSLPTPVAKKSAADTSILRGDTRPRNNPTNNFDYDEDEDADPELNGGVSMSFDHPPSASAITTEHDDGGHKHDHSDLGARRPITAAEPRDERPPLKSSHTTPAGSGLPSSYGMERNAWAEDEGGEEGEITMSFA